LGISSIVLAGGKSLRLRQDKSLATVGNKSLLERVVSRISPISGEIIIVTSEEQTFPQFTFAKLITVADIYPDKGPLGGIYTGLKISNSFVNLVVAADMPFLSQALLRYMVELSSNFDLVVPRVGNLLEPLHGIYTKNCLAPIENMIKQNKLQVRELFPQVKVRYVDTEEIDQFDPRHLSFFNINTEAELAKAQEIARGRKHG